MHLVVELCSVVGVSGEVEDEVLRGMSRLQELSHLVETVGMVIILVGKRHSCAKTHTDRQGILLKGGQLSSAKILGGGMYIVYTRRNKPIFWGGGELIPRGAPE